MKRIFILVSILWSICSVGQNKPPDSLWLLKAGSSNLLSDFQEGYNTFYFESISEFESKEDSFNKLLGTQAQLLFLYDGEKEIVDDFLQNSRRNSNYLFNSSKENQLFGVEKKQLNHIRFLTDSLSEITVCEEFNLISADSLKSKKEIDFFLEDVLYKKGVVPDIITSPFIKNIEYLKKQYYKKPVYKIRVTYNGKDLPKVNWKEFPHLETCGILRTAASTLSPLKRGYMFSPDIYNFTDKNTKITGPKTFRAIRYRLEEKIRYSVPLDDETSNLTNNSDKSTPTAISFKKDQDRGKNVAIFNGTSSYIDIRSQPEERLEEISISAWVKPNEVDGSFSLIGKGEAFSAKIYNGKLQFTTTGIKDHTTSKPVVKKDEWSHVAFVYVPNQKLYFYVNGNLIEEIAASDMVQTDHALLIGSNLWGQYYSGLMSNLKIWERALSDEEIENVFLERSLENQGSFLIGNWLWLSVILLVLIIPALLIYQRNQRRSRHLKKQSKESPRSEKNANSPACTLNREANSINLLNGFTVWNLKGEDITSKFSPKRKELLILILLFTLKEDGITSKKLSDFLWPGFPSNNKKNNRSTQIKELRNIFFNQVDAKIIFSDKKWQLHSKGALIVDVFLLNNAFPGFWSSKKEVLSEIEALDLARIVSKGALLPQLELEWLDNIKAEYSSRVLDLLNPFLENETLNSTEKLEIIEAILVIDPLFETAIRKKVTFLLAEKKYGSAKKTVENYKKLYERYYNETIDPEFLRLVK
ncbi:LamG domain-containing protein [Salegentibacter salegens]|uniref:Two-component response regulator, SAPR family, consists of REC, wHTH and BTAD domains n=1 Tax=Salegentibacter salegens TaxID=143223 RepID=A0A1M7NN14_9FLAO|nr:LamG domain-containing protein [Salegentibacter salegens]PRX43092.1 two-component SAPR family response regulator [Salegentibacter salegens]SHN05386.1 Two-component response regulator, SAPR family, consists of REC, wHTH and BTAD domains [Salegentibacter salegens]